MKVYVVRADYGHYTDAFLKNDYVGIGWFANKPDSYDLERIKEHYKKEYPDDSKMRKLEISALNDLCECMLLVS